MQKCICEVFKSTRKEETYLYVNKQEGLARVPPALLEHFGTPVSAMTLLVTEDKVLARVQGKDLLAKLEQDGYYLQLPPPREAYLLDLYRTPVEGRY